MAQQSTNAGIKNSQRVSEPRMYVVYLHNDDFTPMDFVVDILVNIFGKPFAEAVTIMMDVHTGGRGVAGTYTYDIAHSKAHKAMRLARSEGYPLRLSCEPAQ